MRLDLSVMGIMLLSAALLQSLLPPMPFALLKPPLLAAVALYYALRREPHQALIMALWCGIMLDGLGGLPAGISSFVLLTIALLLLLLRQIIPNEAVGTALLTGAIAVPLLTAAQALALHPQWALPPSIISLLTTLLVASLFGALLTAITTLAGARLDFWAGNVKRKQEIKQRGA